MVNTIDETTSKSDLSNILLQIQFNIITSHSPWDLCPENLSYFAGSHTTKHYYIIIFMFKIHSSLLCNACIQIHNIGAQGTCSLSQKDDDTKRY